MTIQKSLIILNRAVLILIEDFKNRKIRLSEERKKHIENDHPEMSGQVEKINEALLNPDIIVLSKTDNYVEMFYKFYEITPCN